MANVEVIEKKWTGFQNYLDKMGKYESRGARGELMKRLGWDRQQLWGRQSGKIEPYYFEMIIMKEVLEKWGKMEFVLPVAKNLG